MGDIARVSGNEDAAQKRFASALQLRERLVTMEPGRADLEVGLVVSLVGLGGRSSLTRALNILLRLESEGRLSAHQTGWRQGVEEMLGQLEG
jgi:hypothetical protein